MVRRMWIGVVVVSLLAGSASAAEEDTAPGTRRLPEVTVTAEPVQDGGPLPDVQGTQVYAGKKTSIMELSNRPAIVNNNYRQALAKTPGLVLSEETTPLVSIGYRGLTPHRAQFTQVLKDGVPIHADMFGYPEAYYTPALQSVDRIEFVHGGAALMYGPQPGGALNYVTKMPDPESAFAVSSENTFGDDELFSTYTSLSGTLEPLSYLAYGHEREGNGFRQTNSDFEVASGGLKTVLQASEAGRWTLTYDEYHEEHGEPGGLLKAVADGEGRDATTRFNDRFRLERYAGTLLYEHDLDPDRRVELRTFGGHYRRYSKRQGGGGFGTVAAGGTNSIEEQDFYTFGIEPRMRITHDAWGQEDHVLTLGVLGYLSDTPREDQTGATPAADTGTLVRSAKREMQYLSLFAEHLTRFGKLSLTPGVRLEHIWQDVKEEVNTTKGRLDSAREFDVVPLFGLGAAYEVTPEVTAYSNLSQSYRPKIFTEAIPTGSGQVVNNDLEEGKSWQAEIGLRGQAGEAVSWDGSAFLMRFEDQIGTSGNTVENVGDAIYQGLEFAAEVDMTALAGAPEGAGRLTPYVNVLLLDAKFTEGPQDGKTPQYAPQYTVRGGVQYAWEDRAKVQLGTTFVDDHFAEDSNLANRTVPSYKVWDLTGEVRVWKDVVTLLAGINNVFDERYYARIRSDGIDPAPERNIYGGVRVGKRF